MQESENLKFQDLTPRDLPRTWTPFFSRFGSFTPIQKLAIPPMLKKENVVLVSPSASGKTEAVIAPVLEHVLKNAVRTGLRVLYISPTRALVNDLFRRLEEPVTYLHLSIGRKTGDRPKIAAGKLPTILLTTPESFDSILSRQPKILMNLQAVILDEIHLLDNTPRGDQLRVLLVRLRRILESKGNELQYSALSATIDDLSIGDRYFSGGRVCVLHAPREIEYIMVSAAEFVTRLFKIAAERRLKKILAFFNARSLAEGFSRKLDRPPFDGKILVHHASLPKARREDVEREMSQSNRAMLLATSTLELGIDIGDVDGIVLYRPPYNISSLLQRIGRGNRRTDRLFAICVHQNEWERNLFEAFFECAKQGTLYEKRYGPLLSVIPQQIYSYLFQRRRIGTTLKSIFQLLCPIYDENTVRMIFRKLLADGHIKEGRPGIYYLTHSLEKKIEYGKIHSNISEKSFGEYDVYSIVQGNLIGRIYYVLQQFILGGKCWETVKVSEKEKKVYARYLGNGPEFSKIFEGKGAGNYNYLLAPVLKKRFFPDLELSEFPCTFDGRHTHILHLLGSLYSFILADALYAEGIETLDIDGKLLTLHNVRISDGRFPVPKLQTIKKVIYDNIIRLEDALGSGAFFYDLPVEQQIQDHFCNLDIEGFLKLISSLKLVSVAPEYFRAAGLGVRS